MRNIKLFTHTDLDGVGCYIILRSLLPECEVNIDVEFVDNAEVNDKLMEFLNNPDHVQYCNVIISDISCNESVAERINEVNGDNPYISLHDHHQTAMWLNNKYPAWAEVTDDPELSGTSLIFELTQRFMSVIGLDTSWIDDSSYWLFARDVALWDTWHWKTFTEKNDAENLSSLLSLIGREEFIERMLDNLPNDRLIDYESMKLIEQDKKRCNTYIDEHDSEDLMVYFIDGYYFGIVFGSEYTSKLGNTLNLRHSYLDGIIIVTDYGLSFRTIHDDVNVGELAKKFGGGGHQKAAGISFTEEHKKALLDLFFKNNQ